MTSYTDEIKVKISEKYKPPPKINLIIPYAQRQKLNQQVQDNITDYNFANEKLILEKMREWRLQKSFFLKERQSRVELKRQKLEETKKEAIEKMEATHGNEASPNSSNFIVCSSGTNQSNDQSDLKYTMPNNCILIPTQASNSSYSDILKPVQLQNDGKQLGSKEVDTKSPFNLSDFESDTSSPFDNMELKSINDLEELAQVLNQEDISQRLKSNASIYHQSNAQKLQSEVSQPSQSNYKDYFHGGYSGNQYLANIPNSISCNRPNNANFVYSNGYRYPIDFTQVNQQYQNPYTWSKVNNDYMSTFRMTDIDTRKSNCKSVPDIMNAVEVELRNSHLSDLSQITSSEKNRNNVQESRPKSVDDASFLYKNSQTEDSLLKFLSKEEHELCKTISIMGFPLERVARVYQVIGNDQKKVGV